jgi:hypothetical protein
MTNHLEWTGHIAKDLGGTINQRVQLTASPPQLRQMQGAGCPRIVTGAS